jgi:hypothetical protein
MLFGRPTRILWKNLKSVGAAEDKLDYGPGLFSPSLPHRKKKGEETDFSILFFELLLFCNNF